MKTFETLEAARAHAKSQNLGLSSCVVKATHVDLGSVYLASKVPFKVLKANLYQIADLQSLDAEFGIQTQEEIEAATIERLANQNCERCGDKVDGNTCYSQTESTYVGGSKVKVNACYCKNCETLLKAIGAGERTAMDERKTLDVNEA